MRKNKFQEIYQELSIQIQEGKLRANTQLPSEHDLADQYDTSRETVRKALNLLSQNGFIQKIRGKGSIVLETNKFSFPVSGLVSFQELSVTMGKSSVTTVHDFRLIEPDQFLQQQLQTDSNELIWKVLRSRQIDGETIILDKDYFLKKYVSKLTKEIAEKSIYDYLENELGLKISFAKKEIVVVDCTEEDKRLLDLGGFEHIVVVKNYVYLEDASLFQYTESRHRLDKFRFVDFARRGR
ncbi:transcriptional regulator [Fictibacillus phosphorivorans]|uniref:Trehalose operon repressor n=1 Tax=Fictibacillus phosphorivorans TaxID=1221500 RepID=A0A165N7F2_9BACL|nr:trehalose operon repressor [Fictibacillus phosphorivorans]KZE64904.1 transcriptional regulator [Fictibacillus phosphorivorans]